MKWALPPLAALMPLSSPLAAAAPAPPLVALPADRLALARELIALLLPEEKRESMMRTMMAGTLAGMQGSVTRALEGERLTDAQRRRLGDFIQRQTDAAQEQTIEALPLLLDAMAKAYARQFTNRELTEMKAFFATPTGQAYIAKAPSLMADPDVTAVQTQLMEKSMRRMVDDMTAFKRDLMQSGASK